MKTWRHDELQNDLANHLCAGGARFVWTNIVMGEAGAPRPDVLTMAPHSWVNLDLIAYEVKISVSDFRSDVTSGKYLKYLAFAQGVTFAVPAGLVSIADVPKGCGLIQRHDGVWRMLRKPTQAQVELNQRQMIKLMREPRHRPTIPYTENNTDSDYWRDKRLSNTEARTHRIARHKIGQRLGVQIAKYLENSQKAEQVVAEANKQAAEIIETARSRGELAQNQYRDLLDELAAVVGLEKGAILNEIRPAVRKLIERVNGNGEVIHLQAQLDKVRRALDETQPLGAKRRKAVR